jgi:glycosyltransferase involved in cell wall biosynthesis
MSSKIVLVSFLGHSADGYSGLRASIKILVNYYLKNKSRNLRFVFVFQETFFKSLNTIHHYHINSTNNKVILLPNFYNIWLRGFFEQIIIPIIAIIKKVDIIFMPSTFGLLLPIKPVITWVHTNTSFSLSHKLRGVSFLKYITHIILIRLTAFTSKKILFASNTTHKEYCDYIDKSFPKLIVGHPLKFSNYIKKKNTLLNKKIKKYILSVSQFYKLKNFHRLISAFIQLKKQKQIQKKLYLIIVGPIREKNYYKDLLELVSDRNDIFFLHNVTDIDLDILFKNCKAYCFFSLFEGFSLSPAKAIHFGKPTVISNIPTHKEIYGKLAVYANPNSVLSIKLSIIKILNRKKYLYQNSLLKKFKKKHSVDSFINRLEKFFL